MIALLFLSMAHASEVKITPADVKRAECRIACRLGGWDDGSHTSGHCVCCDYVPEEQILKKSIRPPSKLRREEE